MDIESKYGSSNRYLGCLHSLLFTLRRSELHPQGHRNAKILLLMYWVKSAPCFLIRIGLILMSEKIGGTSPHVSIRSSGSDPIFQEGFQTVWVSFLPLKGMAIRVVEFSNGGYKIRKIFA